MGLFGRNREYGGIDDLMYGDAAYDNNNASGETIMLGVPENNQEEAPYQPMTQESVQALLSQYRFDQDSQDIYYRGTNTKITPQEKDSLKKLISHISSSDANTSRLPGAGTVPPQRPPEYSAGNTRNVSRVTQDEIPTNLGVTITKTVHYDIDFGHPSLSAVAGEVTHQQLIRDGFLTADSYQGGSQQQAIEQGVRDPRSGRLLRQDRRQQRAIAERANPDEPEDNPAKDVRPDKKPDKKKKSWKLKTAVGLLALGAATWGAEAIQTETYHLVGGSSTQDASYWSQKGYSDTKKMPVIGGFLARLSPASIVAKFESKDDGDK